MTSLSNVDAPIRRPRSGPTEAFRHRRHYGAARPTPERTMSPMRQLYALETRAAVREHWPVLAFAAPRLVRPDLRCDCKFQEVVNSHIAGLCCRL